MVKKLIILALFMSGCASTRAVTTHSVTPSQYTVHFDSNQNGISEEEKEKLHRYVESTNKTKTIILLEGHTDKTGTSVSNEILAENRARSVFSFLASLGIDISHLTFLSKGEREPIKLGHTKSDNAANRRVEITLTPKEK